MGVPGSDGGGDLGSPRRSARLAPRRVRSSGGGTERCVRLCERHGDRRAVPRVGRRARVDVRRPAPDDSRAEPSRAGTDARKTAYRLGMALRLRQGTHSLGTHRVLNRRTGWARPSAPTARKCSCASCGTPAAVRDALRRRAVTGVIPVDSVGSRHVVHAAVHAPPHHRMCERSAAQRSAARWGLIARTSLHSAAKAENRLELARASDLYIATSLRRSVYATDRPIRSAAASHSAARKGQSSVYPTGRPCRLDGPEAALHLRSRVFLRFCKQSCPDGHGWSPQCR